MYLKQMQLKADVFETDVFKMHVFEADVFEMHVFEIDVFIERSVIKLE